MEKIKVSVVITTFKNPERLVNALINVKRQSYKNIEVIVVDGGNNKINEGICKHYKVKYMKVPSKVVSWEGAFAVQRQRNIGCKASKGEWIAMLDDDDEWEYNKIEKQVGHITNNIALITCWSKIHTEEGFFIDKTKRVIKYKDLLTNFNLSNTSSYFINKKVLKEIGWWDEEVMGMHEYDIALKMAKKGYDIVSVCLPLLIRNRDYHEQLGSMYWKIAEQFQFWRRYGSDVFKELGVVKGIKKGVMTVGLIGVYFSGYLFHNHIWKLIYPMKEMMEVKA